MSPRPIPTIVNRAEISLPAFRRNLTRIRSRLAPGVGILLVVKSDAYGHGMVPMAIEAARNPSVAYFGVAAPEEATALRAAGIRKPVLLLAPAHPDRIPALIRAGVSLSVSSTAEAVRIDRAARRLKRRVRLHAEVDTGMGRLGADQRRALNFLFALQKLESAELEGAYTHFPGADLPRGQVSERQIRVFRMAVELFREMHPGRLRYAHAANSAGLFRFESSHFNLVRPGLSAYGVNPLGTAAPDPGLEPVLSLKTRIAFLKTVDAGASISYRSTYRVRKRSVIATLPIGYSSGYPLRLSNRSRVLIRGRAFPIAGRVTMDQIMVDLGGWTQARLWEDAVLIGVSGRERITAEELARQAGTIPYEILCGIHPKVRRVYSD